MNIGEGDRMAGEFIMGNKISFVELFVLSHRQSANATSGILNDHNRPLEEGGFYFRPPIQELGE
jgi:hypothetical protein